MQVFNLFIAALSSALSLVIMVVVLIHYLYMDVKPELARDIPLLWVTIVAFAIIAVAAWLSVWARARALPWKLWAEAGMVTVGVACLGLLIQLLT